MAPQKRRTGYLFQNYALFPNMTVAQNMAAGLAGERTDKNKEKEQIRRFLRLFQLESLEKLSALRRPAAAGSIGQDAYFQAGDSPF